LIARLKGRVYTLVRLGVTLGAVWLVFHNVDWANLARLLAHADIGLLALSVVPLAAQFIAGVWRWQIIMAMLSGVSVSAPLLAISLGRSLLIGQYLPSTVGSDVVRAALVGHRTGIAIAVRSVICDRVVGLLVLLAMIVATLPLFAIRVDRGAALVAVAGLSIGGLAAFLLFIARVDLLARLPYVGRHTALIATDLRQVFMRGRGTCYILLLSVAAQVFNVLLICGLARALASSISVLQCLLIVPPALLIASVPISLGGWGVREGALAAGFALVGAGSAAGVGASILYGLTSPLVGIVAELATPFVRARNAAPEDAC
jgi:hypothetical protein